MRRDIVAISIPFLLGEVTAGYLPLDFEGACVLGVSALLVITLLLVFYCSAGDHTAISIGLVYLCGIFCFCCASVCPHEALGLPFAKKALDLLQSSIRGLSLGEGDVEGLALALLTGDKGGLSTELITAFRKAGGSHILALSGLHVGIIYAILSRPLWILGRSQIAFIVRTTIVGIASIFYAVMTGLSPSVVRAVLFILIGEISRLLPGRSRRGTNVLCSALLIQLVFNPLAIKSVAFQLSYAAMLGIAVIYPRLESWYPRTGHFDPIRKLWSGASLSLACQATTAPLVWLYWRSFPQYFLLTNLLALPLVEIFVILCIASLLLPIPMINSLASWTGQAIIYVIGVVSTL